MTEVSALQAATDLGVRARAASRPMGRASSAVKNLALIYLVEALRAESAAILSANRLDMDAARANGLSDVMLDRLSLDHHAVEAMAIALEQVVALKDPVGTIEQLTTMPSGIEVGKMRVALGVVAIIYEARPNVTIDAAALCIKSGNAAILRGGSEAFHCNRLLARLVTTALTRAGLPEAGVQLVESTDRAIVGALITLSDYIDVLIPRGGKELIERLSRESKIPMIKHLDGICHVYIDQSAEQSMAVAIVENAKTQRFGTCNTMETLIVHRACAPTLLPVIARVLMAHKVELRGDADACALVSGMGPASEEDWRTEYLAPILSVRIVADMDAAIEHINYYGSRHTDAIVTNDYAHALRFLRDVDSATVMVNASTRFADGFEFGLGAEIGISNDKLHARGPVGLEGLTSLKYVVLGHGEIRA